MRAVALAVALLAITFDFLQPLAHAAVMRGGGAEAAARIWGVFCLPSSGLADDDASSRAPSAGNTHECCLGLAHAPVVAPPPTGFVAVPPVVAPALIVVEAECLTPVGIRDGPTQPRAPPFIV